MTKELWINLPVKDVKRSEIFFNNIGFSIKRDSPGYSPVMVPMGIGSKNVMVILFQNEAFSGTCMHQVADTSKGSEILLSFDVDSREAVDELAKKVEAAGGTLFAKPSDVQGWMYGCGFIDPDGHRWNALFMDMAKIKQ